MGYTRKDGTLCSAVLKRSALLTPRHRQFFDTEGRSRYMPSPQSARTRTLSKLLAWATPAMLAASLSANADCNLTVQFTKADGQPLFTEVTSVIYRMGAFIAADDRHSYTVKLPCPAQYQIAATSTNQQRAREINLRADSKITIDMGQ